MRLKSLFRLTVELAVFVAALPFVVLSAMGVMRPAEGFCVEDWRSDYGDPPTAEELEQSFFVVPELGDRTTHVPFTEWRWPLCVRSLRGHHRSFVYDLDRDLVRLGEPNLRRGVQTGRVYRLLTKDTFSRFPIAFRLEARGASGTGTLSAAWLEGDGQKDIGVGAGAWDDTWRYAPLPKQTVRRTLTAEQTAALQLLFSDLPPLNLIGDLFHGTQLAVESVDQSQRDVRLLILYPPPGVTGRLFCALAEQSGIPAKALKDGRVSVCNLPPG